MFQQRPPISIAPSSPLLPLHEEVEALLFLSEGKPYLLEVCSCSEEIICVIPPVWGKMLFIIVNLYMLLW